MAGKKPQQPVDPWVLSTYETHAYPVDGGQYVEVLREIATRVGLPGRSGMVKTELIHALNTRLEAARERHYHRFDATHCPDDAECAWVFHRDLVEGDCCECCGTVIAAA